MQVTAITTYNRSLIALVRVGVATAGLGAIALVITDVYPLITAIIGVIYGFVIPAWFLRVPFAAYLHDMQTRVVVLVSMATFIPIWIVLLSLIWIIDNRLTKLHEVLILVPMIILMTILFIIWTPHVRLFDDRSMIVHYFKSSLPFIVGLSFGLVLVIILAFSPHAP